jgi:membrane protein
VYLSWFIALLGAMVASALPAIRRPVSSHPLSGQRSARRAESSRGSPRRRGRQAGCTRGAAVATMLRCDMETAQRLLLTMEEREWIARLAAATVPRYILLAKLRSFDARALFDVLVIDRTELNELQPQRQRHRRRGAARRCRTIASTCRSRR